MTKLDNITLERSTNSC